MMIKDLTVSKEIDQMAAVRGGSNTNAGNANFALGGYLGSPAVVVAPVIQVDPFGLGTNINACNFNGAAGGYLGSPAVVVAPVSQM
jgi:hypothetical protein